MEPREPQVAAASTPKVEESPREPERPDRRVEERCDLTATLFLLSPLLVSFAVDSGLAAYPWVLMCRL